MSLDWDEVVAIGLALPGAELTSHYRLPALKANGRPFATFGHGHDDTSFVLHVDRDTVDMLMETDPATYWQTPHYRGWPTVLVRYDTPDPARVTQMIARAHAACLAQAPPRRR